MKYDLSWSGGKDSTASIILAHENNIPIRQINYCRIMWNKYISADLPEMYDFTEQAIKIFRSWGYKVNVITPKSAVEIAFKRYTKSRTSERNGKYYGVTAFCRGHCKMTSCKQSALNQYNRKSIVGIAADEKERLKRLGNNISLLKEYNITELQTFDICRKYDLLSPLYDIPGLKRGGCFFCPNANKQEIMYIKDKYPKLYSLALSLVTMCDYDISKIHNNWYEEYKRGI